MVTYIGNLLNTYHGESKGTFLSGNVNKENFIETLYKEAYTKGIISEKIGNMNVPNDKNSNGDIVDHDITTT